jgi:hypothetical protein
MTIKCPICKKPVETGTPDFPFCSERCRLIDLGNWAAEKYAIPGPSATTPRQETEEEDGDAR